MTFPSTGQRARIPSETNAVPLPAAQTGLWLPTADLGMLRRLRCVGMPSDGETRWSFGAERSDFGRSQTASNDHRLDERQVFADTIASALSPSNRQ
jgi:hypothetical protein